MAPGGVGRPSPRNLGSAPSTRASTKRLRRTAGCPTASPVAAAQRRGGVTQDADSKPAIPAYAWLVFALTFGLLISDYMARQVLNAVFPLAQGGVGADGRAAGLPGGIVAVDGRLADHSPSPGWPIASAGPKASPSWRCCGARRPCCAAWRNYDQMLAARLICWRWRSGLRKRWHRRHHRHLSRHLRATLTGAFMAGGLAGQVLGVGIGGVVAAEHGWRTAFTTIGALGLILAAAYVLVCSRIARLAQANSASQGKVTFANLRSLFAGRRPEMRLCRQRAAIVRGRGAARLAANLFRPLL